MLTLDGKDLDVEVSVNTIRVPVDDLLEALCEEFMTELPQIFCDHYGNDFIEECAEFAKPLITKCPFCNHALWTMDVGLLLVSKLLRKQLLLLGTKGAIDVRSRIL